MVIWKALILKLPEASSLSSALRTGESHFWMFFESVFVAWRSSLGLSQAIQLSVANRKFPGKVFSFCSAHKNRIRFQNKHRKLHKHQREFVQFENFFRYCPAAHTKRKSPHRLPIALFPKYPHGISK